MHCWRVLSLAKWNRSVIKVRSKWTWSEIEVNSKWTRSEIELNTPPHPPISYPTLVGLIGIYIRIHFGSTTNRHCLQVCRLSARLPCMTFAGVTLTSSDPPTQTWTRSSAQIISSLTALFYCHDRRQACLFKFGNNPWKPFSGKLRVSQFPIFLFLFVGHFQNAFSQKAAGPAATSFGENPRTHSEVQGPLGDDVTFQESLKSWQINFYYFVRPDSARAGPKKLRTICSLMSVLSEPFKIKKNPL